MALRAKVGTFTKTVAAAPAAQVVSGISDGNGDFQPVALMLWGSEQTAEGIAANLSVNIGLSDGVNEYAVSFLSLDNVAAVPQVFRRHEFSAYRSIGALATVTSFDVGSFTLSLDPNTATADLIHYLAIGGSGVEAKVGTFISPGAVPPFTGEISVVGAGFEPESAMFLGALYGSAFGPPQQDFNEVVPNFGFAVSASEQAALGCVISAVRAPVLATSRTQRTDRCINVQQTAASPPITGVLQFMDADGFTLIMDQFADQWWGYLALRGGSFAIGSVTQPTSPSLQTIALDFDPAAVLVASFNRVASTVIEDHARFALGGASVADEGTIWAGHTDLSDPTSADRATSISKALQLIDTDAPAAVDAEADLSLGSRSFTLDWTTVDAEAREVLYFAMGPEPPLSFVIGLLAICTTLGIDPWTLVSSSGFLKILEAFIGSGFVPDPDAEKLSLEDMEKRRAQVSPSGFVKDSSKGHLWDL